MNFKTYYTSLNEQQRNKFAEDSGYERGHIESHLIHARKVPRREKMPALIKACLGHVSWNEMLDHFYSPVMTGESVKNIDTQGVACLENSDLSEGSKKGEMRAAA